MILIDKYGKIPNCELENLIPNKTPLAIYKKAYKMGFRKTREQQFINRSLSRLGSKCPTWKGGRKKTKKGYIQILKKDHKRADRNGYVFEHIYVFEKETGIEVPKSCVVHHINGIKDDNRIENLCLMTFGAHTAYHNMERNNKHE